MIANTILIGVYFAGFLVIFQNFEAAPVSIMANSIFLIMSTYILQINKGDL